MPITPESAGTVSSPNDLTEQTAGTTSSPNDLTEGTAGTVSSPNDLTEGTAGTVLSPNDLTEATAGAASSPNDLTEATAGAVASPNDLTEVTAAGFPRPFVPLLSLDFKNGLYMQQRTPRSISDVIVYNRASNASYLDSYLDIGGREKFIIREDWVGSVTNLVEYSEDFTVVDWALNNTTVSAPIYSDPFGGFNASLLKEDATASTDHSIFYDPGFSGDHVWSVYAKYAGRHLSINNRDGSATVYAVFNLLNGFVSFQDGSTYLSASMEHVGNGWFRCDLRFNDGTSHGVEFSLVKSLITGTASPNYNGDNESGVYIFGAQCTQTERTTPYIKTTGTTVAQTFVEQPRFEVDALNGQPLGMLSENSATNIWLSSEIFSNSLNISLTENIEIAPDGTRTASLVVPDATSTTSHQVSSTTSLVDTTVYTFSVFAKAAGYNYLLLDVTLNDGSGVRASFDLRDGSTAYDDGTPAYTGSRYYGNGWWRCHMTFINTSGVSVNTTRIRVQTDNLNNAFSGDTVRGVYIWGAQVEANPYPTTYIRTEGGSATRVGDDGDSTAVYFYNPFDTYQNKDISIHCEFTANSAAYDDQFSNDIFNIGTNTSNVNRLRVEKSSDATSGGLYIVYGDGNDVVRPTTFDENISSITLVITAARGVRFYIDGVLDYESSSVLDEGAPQLAEILTLFNNSTSAHIKRALFFGYALTTEEVAQL